MCEETKKEYRGGDGELKKERDRCAQKESEKIVRSYLVSVSATILLNSASTSWPS